MSNPNNIAVLISGGVDSAVVVHKLCEQGYKPDLHYIKIGMEGEDSSCTAEEDIELSTATARKYGLNLEVTDLQKEYWEQVVGYAIDRIKRGLTPNPDVMCNRFIKFGAFEQLIGHHYDKIATGHYATTILDNEGRTWLGTAKDPVKDQTDFLAQLSYQQLSHTIFPIGHLMKEEVRQIALDAHLPSAYRKDSQGICFLGKINYNDFIRKFMGEQEGRVIDIETGKVVGRHKGFWFHTIGQRKGLGLSGGPWFVVKKNIKKNIIFVAHGWDTQLQYGHQFRLADFHAITAPLPLQPGEEMPIQFKIRHVDHFMQGTIRYEAPTSPIDGDASHLTLLNNNGSTQSTLLNKDAATQSTLLNKDGATQSTLLNNNGATQSTLLNKDAATQSTLLNSGSALQGTYVVQSPEPIQGIAPGQFGCIYDKDARFCYGSGEIGI